MGVSWEDCLGLFVVMAAVSALPGPIEVAITMQAMSFGVRRVAPLIAGLAVADWLWVLAAAGGVRAVTGSWAGLQTCLKLIGCAMLAWIAITELVRAPRERHGTAPTGGASFLAGCALTLGDVKAIGFYFGVLPALVDLSRATGGDLALVAFTASAAVAVVKFAYAGAGSMIRIRATRPGGLQCIRRLAAWMLAAAATWIAVAELLRAVPARP